MRKRINLLAFLLLFGSIAFGQLGNFKIPKKEKSKSYPAMVYNETMPVSIDYKYVIEDIKLNMDNGVLHNQFVKITFPPVNDAKGTIDYAAQTRVWVQLTNGETTFFKNPYKVMHNKSTYKVFIPNQQGTGYVDPNNAPLKPGKYSLNYFLDDSCFYELPFTVSELKTDDPYAEKQSKYLINGFWNDYGFIEIQKDGNLVFNCYLRDENFKPKGANAHILWIDLMKGDKIITGDTEETKKATKNSPTLYNDWVNVNKAFINGADKSKYLQLSDLEDGTDYRFVVSFDNVKTDFKFAVKDHKIVPQDNQIFSKENAKHYMEGMGTVFFIPKAK